MRPPWRSLGNPWIGFIPKDFAWWKYLSDVYIVERTLGASGSVGRRAGEQGQVQVIQTDISVFSG